MASARLTSIAATTTDKIQPVLADAMHEAFPVWKYFVKNKKLLMKKRGGYKHYFPVLFTSNSNLHVNPQAATATLTYAVPDTTTTDIQAAEYDWCYFQNDATIDGAEANENSGTAEVVDLTKTKLRAAVESIGEDMNSKFMSAGSAAGATKRGTFHGLRRFCDYAGADNGGVVGGIDYDSADITAGDWSNQYVTGQADYTDLGDKLVELFLKIRAVRGRPDLMVMHTDVYAAYEKIGQNALMMRVNDKLDIGFMTYGFKGVPILIDEAAKNGAGGADESAYMLDSRNIGMVVNPDRYMKAEKWTESQIHYDLVFSRIRLMCYSWCNNRKRQGVAVFSA